MPDYNDPLSAAIAGRGNVFRLDTATQPGQTALDRNRFSVPQIDRRQYLINQLPNARSVRDFRAINSEIGAIDREALINDRQLRFEASQRRQMAHDQAELAAKALKIDRETSIDEQGAALMTGLGRLDALHRNGRINDSEFDAQLLNLGQQYNLGTRHPTAGKMFEHYVTEADKRNAFNARRLTSEVTKLAARYGVEPQIDPETQLPSLQLTKSAALQTDKGKAELFKEMNQEMFQKYGIGTGVNSLFNPIEPHSSPDKGKTIAIPFYGKEGKVEKVNVPTPLFNQMKTDFNDRYFSIVGPQQQSGLQPGTTRSVGGVNYSWNGTRWEAQ